MRGKYVHIKPLKNKDVPSRTKYKKLKEARKKRYDKQRRELEKSRREPRKPGPDTCTECRGVIDNGASAFTNEDGSRKHAECPRW